MPVPSISGPDRFIDVDEIVRPWGECGSVASIARWLREQWERALEDLGWRDNLIDIIEGLRAQLEDSQQSFGDALEAFVSVDALELEDGWPTYRDALNRLPRRMQIELVDQALGAMRGAMQFDLTLMYSTNGAMGVESSTWYSDGAFPPHDDVTATRQVRLVCPSFHTPVPDLT